MICEKCGAKHNEEIFCPVCGAPVRNVLTETDTSNKKRSHHLMGKVVMAGIILAGVGIAGAVVVSANTKVQNDDVQENQIVSEKLMEKSSFKCNNSDYNIKLYYITNNNELKKAGNDNIYMSDTLNIGSADDDKNIRITSYKNNIIQKSYDNGSKITVEMDVTDNGRQNVIIKKDGINTKLIENCNNNVVVKFSENSEYFCIYTYEISNNIRYSKENEMTYGDVKDTIYIMNSDGECVRTYENGMHDALVTYYNNYVVDITDDGNVLYYNYGKIILISHDGKDEYLELCTDNKEVCSLAFVDRKRCIAGFRGSSHIDIITYNNDEVARCMDSFECRNAWIYNSDTAELVYTDMNNKIILRDIVDDTLRSYDNSFAITKLIMNDKYICISQYNTIIVIDKVTGKKVYDYKVNAEASEGELTISFANNLLVINNPLGDCVIWDGNSKKTVETEKTIYNLDTVNTDGDGYYTAIVDGELGIINTNMEFYPVTTDYMSYSVTEADDMDEYSYSTSRPIVYNRKLFYINSSGELIEYNMETHNAVTVAENVKGYLIIK